MSQHVWRLHLSETSCCFIQPWTRFDGVGGGSAASVASPFVQASRWRQWRGAWTDPDVCVWLMTRFWPLTCGFSHGWRNLKGFNVGTTVCSIFTGLSEGWRVLLMSRATCNCSLWGWFKAPSHSLYRHFSTVNCGGDLKVLCEFLLFGFRSKICCVL